MASIDRVRAENGRKPEDAVRKIQDLRRAVGKVRGAFFDEGLGAKRVPPAKVLGEIADEIKRWDEALEDVRLDLAELIAECDRWRIAHDKLRERMDHHSIEPRSEVERSPQSAKIFSPRPRPASGESQDFSAIDAELERLNASMLRAFNSE